MTFLKRFAFSLIIVAAPVLTLIVKGPLEVFSGNSKEFNFVLSDFFPSLICVALFVLIMAALILAILPKKIRDVVICVIGGLELCMYVQNMFLNKQLSTEDGSPMAWEEMSALTTQNLIIWLVILAVFSVVIIKLKDRSTLILFESFALTVIQLVVVVSLLFSYKAPVNSNLQMSGDKQFSVAKDENIIVFVIDTFGNAQLDKVMADHPEILDELHDFTYYNNADCHYYCTFPSMTHMFTSIDFDFESESKQWMHNAWTSDEANRFYNAIHEKGFTCNFFSTDIGYTYGNIANLMGKFDNIEEKEKEIDQKEVLSKFLKMSVFRSVPYILKPHFEVLTSDFSNVVSFKEGKSVIHSNSEFYEGLHENGLTIDSSMNKAFIIEHIFGTHKPYTMDENGQYLEGASLDQTVRGLLKIVADYLEELKRLDLYDNSTIIITADHGSWGKYDPQPIFFYKAQNENHEVMQVNSAPISHDDILATLSEVSGIDKEGYGTTIWDWNPGDTRERTVYMRINDDNYPKVQGSSLFNLYHGFTYTTDRNEIVAKMNETPDYIIPATPWY